MYLGSKQPWSLCGFLKVSSSRSRSSSSEQMPEVSQRAAGSEMTEAEAEAEAAKTTRMAEVKRR